MATTTTPYTQDTTTQSQNQTTANNTGQVLTSRGGPDWLTGAQQTYLNAATNQLNQPIQPYSGQLSSGLSTNQTAAANMAGQPAANASYLTQAGQLNNQDPGAQYFGQLAQLNNQSAINPYLTQAGQLNAQDPTAAYLDQFNAGNQTSAINPFLAQAQQAYQGGARQLRGADLSGYMNPYTTNALDTAANDLNRQRDIQLNQERIAAGARGAFGNNRTGLVEGQIYDNNTRALADLYGQGRANAYNQAVQNFFQDNQARTALGGNLLNLGQAAQSAQQQRLQNLLAGGNMAQSAVQQRLTNAQNIGQLAQSAQQQQIGNLQNLGQNAQALNQQRIGNLQALGQSAQNAQQQQFENLASTGAVQQSTAQGALDRAYQNYLTNINNSGLPLSRAVSALQTIQAGAPSVQNQTTSGTNTGTNASSSLQRTSGTTTMPANSTAQNVLGGAATAAGIYNQLGGVSGISDLLSGIGDAGSSIYDWLTG